MESFIWVCKNGTEYERQNTKNFYNCNDKDVMENVGGCKYAP